MRHWQQRKATKPSKPSRLLQQVQATERGSYLTKNYPEEVRADLPDQNSVTR